MFTPKILYSQEKTTRSGLRVSTIVLVAAGLLTLLALSACGTAGRPLVMVPTHAPLSPAPITAPLTTAWKQAERYAASHPNAEVFLGRGNSMLPLYPDRTILVVERQAMAEWKPGMSVAFEGSRGAIVVHVLVEPLPKSWITAGLGNLRVDNSLVNEGNYLGTVIRAYVDKPNEKAPGAELARLDSGILERTRNIARLAW